VGECSEDVSTSTCVVRIYLGKPAIHQKMTAYTKPKDTPSQNCVTTCSLPTNYAELLLDALESWDLTLSALNTCKNWEGEAHTGRVECLFQIVCKDSLLSNSSVWLRAFSIHPAVPWRWLSSRRTHATITLHAPRFNTLFGHTLRSSWKCPLLIIVLVQRGGGGKRSLVVWETG